MMPILLTLFLNFSNFSFNISSSYAVVPAQDPREDDGTAGGFSTPDIFGDGDQEIQIHPIVQQALAQPFPQVPQGPPQGPQLVLQQAQQSTFNPHAAPFPDPNSPPLVDSSSYHSDQLQHLDPTSMSMDPMDPTLMQQQLHHMANFSPNAAAAAHMMGQMWAVPTSDTSDQHGVPSSNYMSTSNTGNMGGTGFNHMDMMSGISSSSTVPSAVGAAQGSAGGGPGNFDGFVWYSSDHQNISSHESVPKRFAAGASSQVYDTGQRQQISSKFGTQPVPGSDTDRKSTTISIEPVNHSDATSTASSSDVNRNDVNVLDPHNTNRRITPLPKPKTKSITVTSPKIQSTTRWADESSGESDHEDNSGTTTNESSKTLNNRQKIPIPPPPPPVKPVLTSQTSSRRLPVAPVLSPAAAAAAATMPHSNCSHGKGFTSKPGMPWAMPPQFKDTLSAEEKRRLGRDILSQVQGSRSNHNGPGPRSWAAGGGPTLKPRQQPQAIPSDHESGSEASRGRISSAISVDSSVGGHNSADHLNSHGSVTVSRESSATNFPNLTTGGNRSGPAAAGSHSGGSYSGSGVWDSYGSAGRSNANLVSSAQSVSPSGAASSSNVKGKSKGAQAGQYNNYGTNQGKGTGGNNYSRTNTNPSGHNSVSTKTIPAVRPPNTKTKVANTSPKAQANSISQHSDYRSKTISEALSVSVPSPVTVSPKNSKDVNYMKNRTNTGDSSNVSVPSGPSGPSETDSTGTTQFQVHEKRRTKRHQQVWQEKGSSSSSSGPNHNVAAAAAVEQTVETVDLTGTTTNAMGPTVDRNVPSLPKPVTTGPYVKPPVNEVVVDFQLEDPTREKENNNRVRNYLKKKRKNISHTVVKPSNIIAALKDNVVDERERTEKLEEKYDEHYAGKDRKALLGETMRLLRKGAEVVRNEKKLAKEMKNAQEMKNKTVKQKREAQKPEPLAPEAFDYIDQGEDSGAGVASLIPENLIKIVPETTASDIGNATPASGSSKKKKKKKKKKGAADDQDEDEEIQENLEEVDKSQDLEFSYSSTTDTTKDDPALPPSPSSPPNKPRKKSGSIEEIRKQRLKDQAEQKTRELYGDPQAGDVPVLKGNYGETITEEQRDKFVQTMVKSMKYDHNSIRDMMRDHQFLRAVNSIEQLRMERRQEEIEKLVKEREQEQQEKRRKEILKSIKNKDGNEDFELGVANLARQLCVDPDEVVSKLSSMPPNELKELLAKLHDGKFIDKVVSIDKGIDIVNREKVEEEEGTGPCEEHTREKSSSSSEGLFAYEQGAAASDGNDVPEFGVSDNGGDILKIAEEYGYSEIGLAENSGTIRERHENRQNKTLASSSGEPSSSSGPSKSSKKKKNSKDKNVPMFQCDRNSDSSEALFQDNLKRISETLGVKTTSIEVRDLSQPVLPSDGPNSTTGLIDSITVPTTSLTSSTLTNPEELQDVIAESTLSLVESVQSSLLKSVKETITTEENTTVNRLEDTLKQIAEEGASLQEKKLVDAVQAEAVQAEAVVQAELSKIKAEGERGSEQYLLNAAEEALREGLNAVSEVMDIGNSDELVTNLGLNGEEGPGPSGSGKKKKKKKKKKSKGAGGGEKEEEEDDDDARLEGLIQGEGDNADQCVIHTGTRDDDSSTSTKSGLKKYNIDEVKDKSKDYLKTFLLEGADFTRSPSMSKSKDVEDNTKETSVMIDAASTSTTNLRAQPPAPPTPKKVFPATAGAKKQQQQQQKSEEKRPPPPMEPPPPRAKMEASAKAAASNLAKAAASSTAKASAAASSSTAKAAGSISSKLKPQLHRLTELRNVLAYRYKKVFIKSKQLEATLDNMVGQYGFSLNGGYHTEFLPLIQRTEGKWLKYLMDKKFDGEESEGDAESDKTNLKTKEESRGDPKENLSEKAFDSAVSNSESNYREFNSAPNSDDNIDADSPEFYSGGETVPSLPSDTPQLPKKNVPESPIPSSIEPVTVSKDLGYSYESNISTAAGSKDSPLLESSNEPVISSTLQSSLSNLDEESDDACDKIQKLRDSESNPNTKIKECVLQERYIDKNTGLATQVYNITFENGVKRKSTVVHHPDRTEAEKQWEVEVAEPEEVIDIIPNDASTMMEPAKEQGSESAGPASGSQNLGPIKYYESITNLDFADLRDVPDLDPQKDPVPPFEYPFFHRLTETAEGVNTPPTGRRLSGINFQALEEIMKIPMPENNGDSVSRIAVSQTVEVRPVSTAFDKSGNISTGTFFAECDMELFSLWSAGFPEKAVKLQKQRQLVAAIELILVPNLINSGSSVIDESGDQDQPNTNTVDINDSDNIWSCYRHRVAELSPHASISVDGNPDYEYDVYDSPRANLLRTAANIITLSTEYHALSRYLHAQLDPIMTFFGAPTMKSPQTLSSETIYHISNSSISQTAYNALFIEQDMQQAIANQLKGGPTCDQDLLKLRHVLLNRIKKRLRDWFMIGEEEGEMMGGNLPREEEGVGGNGSGYWDDHYRDWDGLSKFNGDNSLREKTIFEIRKEQFENDLHESIRIQKEKTSAEKPEEEEQAQSGELDQDILKKPGTIEAWVVPTELNVDSDILENTSLYQEPSLLDQQLPYPSLITGKDDIDDDSFSERYPFCPISSAPDAWLKPFFHVTGYVLDQEMLESSSTQLVTSDSEEPIGSNVSKSNLNSKLRSQHMSNNFHTAFGTHQKLTPSLRPISNDWNESLEFDMLDAMDLDDGDLDEDSEDELSSVEDKNVIKSRTYAGQQTQTDSDLKADSNDNPEESQKQQHQFQNQDSRDYSYEADFPDAGFAYPMEQKASEEEGIRYWCAAEDRSVFRTTIGPEIWIDARRKVQEKNPNINPTTSTEAYAMNSITSETAAGPSPTETEREMFEGSSGPSVPTVSITQVEKSENQHAAFNIASTKESAAGPSMSEIEREMFRTSNDIDEPGPEPVTTFHAKVNSSKNMYECQRPQNPSTVAREAKAARLEWWMSSLDMISDSTLFASNWQELLRLFLRNSSWSSHAVMDQLNGGGGKDELLDKEKNHHLFEQNLKSATYRTVPKHLDFSTVPLNIRFQTLFPEYRYMSNSMRQKLRVFLDIRMLPNPEDEIPTVAKPIVKNSEEEPELLKENGNPSGSAAVKLTEAAAPSENASSPVRTASLVYEDEESIRIDTSNEQEFYLFDNDRNVDAVPNLNLAPKRNFDPTNLANSIRTLSPSDDIAEISPSIGP